MKPKQPKYEVMYHGNWKVTDEKTFREWPNRRRLNGEPYTGPTYYRGTTEAIPPEILQEHANCDHTVTDLRKRYLAEAARIAGSFSVPEPFVKGVMTQALISAAQVARTDVLMLLVDPQEMKRLRAIMAAFSGAFTPIGVELLKISEKKMYLLLTAVWEAATAIVDPEGAKIAKELSSLLDEKGSSEGGDHVVH